MASNNTRSVNVAFSVSGADSSRHEVEKVRKEIEDFGDEGKKSAQKFADSMAANDASWERLERAVVTGSPAIGKHFNALALQTQNFREALIATFGTAEQAPEAARAALAKYESRLESATDHVRRSKDALQEQNTELAEGGEKWTGLGDAINKSLGPLGSVQAKLGLIAAAFREGWQAGQQLNQLFGTDMSLWDEAVSRFGQKANLIIKDIADGVVAMVSATKALLTGHLGDAKKALEEMGAANQKLQKDLAASVTKYEGEWDRYAKTQKVATEETKKATDAHEKLAKTVDEGADKQDELSEKVDKATSSIRKQTDAVKEQGDKDREATDALLYKTAGLDGLKSKTEEATAATKQHGEATQEMSALARFSAISQQAQVDAADDLARANALGTDQIYIYTDATGKQTIVNQRYIDSLHMTNEQLDEYNSHLVKVADSSQKITGSVSGTQAALNKLLAAIGQGMPANTEAIDEQTAAFKRLEDQANRAADAIERVASSGE